MDSRAPMTNPRKRAFLSLFLFLFILVPSIYTGGYRENVFFIHEHIDYPKSMGHFYFNFSTSFRSSDWMVVKFYSPSSFTIEELNFSGEAIFNEGRSEIMEFIFTNFNDTYHWHIGEEYVSPWDFFVHINVGKINYTKNHLKYYNESEPVPFWMKWYDINTSFKKGTWYFIGYVSPSDNADLHLSINGMGNLGVMGYSEGNSTYMYEMEEFLGNFNLWNRMILITINGEKKIEIKNDLFIAHFETCAGAGFVNLQYISPKNEKYTVFYRITGWWDIFLYIKKDFDIWKPFIKESNGEWTIKFSAFVRHDLQSIISHRMHSDYPIPPEVAYIAVADIKLP